MLQSCKPNNWSEPHTGGATSIAFTWLSCKLPGSERKKYYHAAGLQSETSSWKLFASISRVNKLFSSIRLICSCLNWGLMYQLQSHYPGILQSHHTMLRKALIWDQCPSTYQCGSSSLRPSVMYSFVTCLVKLAYRITFDFSHRICSWSTTEAEGDILLGRKIASRLDQAPVFLKASDKVLLTAFMAL